ncbi:hypothetical protein SISNIDRAFT_482138 [Sistotremastrum niveocremeum HHB9708]|uniref:F-box domain-containing protein n=1 Tax=Sistotremastrum niveocremeum HHB9708 TaxID=1314777 RepID=A0A164YT09_9AGAM|nr:hypothetical protein SISNIDRAFT_482138 [Sistotremastrum niveocremeum HHB9708]
MSRHPAAEMRLPPEILGRIVRGIRDPNRVLFQDLTLLQWSKENATLHALSRVSKMMRIEVIPALWSEVMLIEPSRNPQPLEERISNVLGLLKAFEPSYAIHLQRLSIGSPFSYPKPENFTNNIREILDLSTHLRCLELKFNCFSSDTSFILLLSSLTFPHLRSFAFSLVNFLEEDLEGPRILGEFLIRHPLLEIVHLVGDLVHPNWQRWRKSNPLPILKHFRGDMWYLSMLASSKHLTTLESYTLNSPGDTTLRWVHELSELVNPFSNVTHFTINDDWMSLQEITLRALAQSFPALQFLDGAAVSEAFLLFISTDIEPMKSCLPNLQQLIMYETCGSQCSVHDSTRFTTPTDAEIEAAFRYFPFLFPALSSTTHVKMTLPAVRPRKRQIMRMHFSAEGPVVERDEA